ncbi:MAG: hypothetical protein F6K14_30025 [Symploca sp. SIO2C1]|nr:hypothetical protein [Symploca sp. SIO2C1]
MLNKLFNCQYFQPKKFLALGLVWLLLLLSLIACQAQTWSNTLSINPDYRGPICLYVGSWKGKLTFNIVSDMLEYQVDVRSGHNDKKAFEFVALGNQGSQLYVNYLPTPSKVFNDSSGKVYQISITPKLYYDSCEVVAPKTVLNFPLWDIYDLDNPNSLEFKPDPEILTWSIVCGLGLLAISGILSLLLGFRAVGYELLKLWSLQTTKLINLSSLPELARGQELYCQLQGQVSQVKRNQENNLPLAVEIKIGTETIPVMVEGLEIISPLSLPVYLFSSKRMISLQLETLVGKSVLVMGLLTHKSFGWRVNMVKSIFRPRLISSYNLAKTSLRGVKSIAIGIVIILLGIVILSIFWTLLMSRW